MVTTRVFSNGESQFINIPEEYRFDVDEVFIKKIGNVLFLIPDKGLADEFEKGDAAIKDLAHIDIEKHKNLG